jgi:hypothetical protein
LVCFGDKSALLGCKGAIERVGENVALEKRTFCCVALPHRQHDRYSKNANLHFFERPWKTQGQREKRERQEEKKKALVPFLIHMATNVPINQPISQFVI